MKSETDLIAFMAQKNNRSAKGLYVETYLLKKDIPNYLNGTIDISFHHVVSFKIICKYLTT